MTDVPRRSYPLVVPPPGGFEQAVHRGRSLRRRRTGGGSAMALVFVGALAYSMLGHGTGTTSLGPADHPKVQHTEPVAGTSETPSPQATPSGANPDSATTASGPRGGGPIASRTPGSYVRPPAGSGPAGPVYAPRQAISGPMDLDPGSNPHCLASTSQTGWCATASVAPPTASVPDYVLTYTLCRYATAGTALLTFKRTQQVDFIAVDVDHNDTVWTYSKGVPVTKANATKPVDGGYCVQWQVRWDGYDDFGRLPPMGSYRLVARSLSVESVPTATYNFQHE